MKKIILGKDMTPPYKKKKIYVKVPQFMKKTDYEFEMRNKMISDRPALPLTIKKVTEPVALIAVIRNLQKLMNCHE